MFQIMQPNVRSSNPLRPASNNEIHMPSFSPIRTRTLHRVSVNKEKNNYGKITNTSITRISNPAIGAKILFETYNCIIEVFPHSSSVCEYKTYPINVDTGTRTNVVRFQQCCCYALTGSTTPPICTNGPSPPSSAAELTSRTPGKINEV
jgi:hypothetical protein